MTFIIGIDVSQQTVTLFEKCNDKLDVHGVEFTGKETFRTIFYTIFLKEVCPISGYLLRIFVHIIYFVIGMFLINTVELLAKYLYKNENCIKFTGKVTFTLVKIFLAELQPLVRTFLYGIYPVYMYIYSVFGMFPLKLQRFQLKMFKTVFRQNLLSVWKLPV